MKIVSFDENVIKICWPASNWQYSNIGSENGLAQVRRQAIIWINDGLS